MMSTFVFILLCSFFGLALAAWVTYLDKRLKYYKEEPVRPSRKQRRRNRRNKKTVHRLS